MSLLSRLYMNAHNQQHGTDDSEKFLAWIWVPGDFDTPLCRRRYSSPYCAKTEIEEQTAALPVCAAEVYKEEERREAA